MPSGHRQSIRSSRGSVLPEFRLHPTLGRCILHSPASVCVIGGTAVPIIDTLEDAGYPQLPSSVDLQIGMFWGLDVHLASSFVRANSIPRWKLLYFALLCSLLLFSVFRHGVLDLHTSLSIPSAVVTMVAVFLAAVSSFLEDTRSIRPSDLLVLYFSATTVLYIPVLRTLWLMSDNDEKPRILWTLILLLTILVTLTESSRKASSLAHLDAKTSKEQVSGIWGRSLWTWVIPLLRICYNKIICLDNVPRVDTDLREESTWNNLDKAWRSVRGHRHGLLRAAFSANRWSFISAVPPRLALSAFTFCQPFFIGTSVSYLNNQQPSGGLADSYRAGLIGACILIYLGISVSSPRLVHIAAIETK